MSGTTTIQAGGAERAAQPAKGSGRRLRRRHLWLIPGLGIAIFANLLGEGNGVGILALVAFGVTPDLPRLAGHRARSLHDVLHHPALPIAAAAISATGVAAGVLPVLPMVGALVWLGHVVAGRGVGDVPRGAGEPTRG